MVALLVLDNDYKNLDYKIILKEVEKINNHLTKIEKIKKFLIIKKQFSIENGFMTPTLKLKRYKIIQEYNTELEKLYN